MENQQVLEYISSKFPYEQQTIREGLENGCIFNIATEGNESESQALQKILIDNDFYERPQSRKAKIQAVLFLQKVVEEWSLGVAKNEKKISPEEIPNYSARVLPFGSYVLDLNSNDSDVDVICVVPNFIDREKHFFGGLAEILEGKPGVKNLLRIPNSSVPIITFDYKGLPIDISFSQLNREIVPRDIDKKLQNELIESIPDQKCQTSILGRKNNMMILESIKKHPDRFKSLLKLIKVWCKNRGISSNQMGYLGGISWAILCAKICQIFSQHYPNKLLLEFFRIYSRWDWKNCPIKIVKMSYEKSSTSLMTVLTPGSAYNSTQRINDITFNVLTKEIKRACQLLQKNEVRQVFDRVDFINEYPIYIEIDIYGETSEPSYEREYNEFKGTVESKLIGLIRKISQFCKSDIESGKLRVVPYPRTYKKTDEKYLNDYCYFFGVKIEKDAKRDILKAVTSWCQEILAIRKDRKYLGVKIFETNKAEIEEDVEVDEHKRRREERERNDPRKGPVRMPRPENDSFKKFLK